MGEGILEARFPLPSPLQPAHVIHHQRPPVELRGGGGVGYSAPNYQPNFKLNFIKAFVAVTLDKVYHNEMLQFKLIKQSWSLLTVHLASWTGCM